MIKSITLDNFKVFQNREYAPLSKINLLTGANGKGKSSLLQSLLIFMQSWDWQQQLNREVVLNGSLVNLGTFFEVRNARTSHSKEIQFEFELFDESMHYVQMSENESDDSMGILREEFPSNLEILTKIHFIAADRFGPQLSYVKEAMRKFQSVGSKGEFTGNILYKKRNDLVDELLIRDKETSEALEVQIGKWLGFILNTEDIRVNTRDVGNNLITISFQFGNNERQYKPSNVGFGYSYILPIVLSGLIAKPNEILIIENPEAHIHPLAQSRLIEFLGLVAQNGVQIIIESHSEHILNALRISVADKNTKLSKDDVSVLFLGGNGKKIINVIDMESDGSIDSWPEYFFDQTGNDLKKLISLK